MESAVEGAGEGAVEGVTEQPGAEAGDGEPVVAATAAADGGNEEVGAAESAEPALPKALEYVSRPDEQLLILEVRLKRYILADGMFGYIEEGGLLLPLGEYVRMLEFNISVDTSNGRANGW
jgi:hypothetical protein